MIEQANNPTASNNHIFLLWLEIAFNASMVSNFRKKHENFLLASHYIFVANYTYTILMDLFSISLKHFWPLQLIIEDTSLGLKI